MDVQKDERLESGYQILNIVLVESSFTRISNINFADKDIKTNITADASHSIVGDQITAELTVLLSVDSKGDSLASVKVRMVGSFRAIGSPQLLKEDFASVNAQAIVYPFIREHISNISVKGGLGQFLIPPLNFTKKKSIDSGKQLTQN